MKTLKTTLRAWPMIFLIAVTLSYLTQLVAKLFGVELPDQAQVELVRQHAGWNLQFAALVLQIVILIPVCEEFLFRCLLWRLPLGLSRQWRKGRTKASIVLAVLGAALFSFAHYVDFAALAKEGAFALTGWNSAFLALFFFALAQCWLYRKTNWLWSPMLNHSLFNLTNLVLLFILPEA